MKALLSAVLFAGSLVLCGGDAYPSGNPQKDKLRLQMDSYPNCAKMDFSQEDGRGVCSVKLLQFYNNPAKNMSRNAYFALFVYDKVQADKTLGFPMKPNTRYRISFDLRKKGQLKGIMFYSYGLKSSKSFWAGRVPLGKDATKRIGFPNENWKSCSYELASGDQANAVLFVFSLNNTLDPALGDQIFIRNIQFAEIP